jgi:hypothetical protein
MGAVRLSTRHAPNVGDPDDEGRAMSANTVDSGGGVDPAGVLRTGPVDRDALRADFVRQGAFVHVEDVLPVEVSAQLAADARTLVVEVNRNYLPGHKKGGSVGRHTIDRLAPSIARLYRSRALVELLEKTCGERLLPCPADDPHAYALYYYTKAGDHIGWHYDTSYYDGRRYTVLLGVVDESSCRLDYQLHTRETDTPVESGSIRIAPGAMVFFDGDRLRHRITPAGENEFRVSLTFEYVTDPGMRPWRRVISNLKDAVAYFGFRQILRGRDNA